MDNGHTAVAILGELVPFFIFGVIAAIVISARYFRFKERAQMQDTLRAAYERGQPVGPEIIEALQSAPREIKRNYGPERDLRRGIFWMAWSIAFLAGAGALYFYDPSNDGTGGLMFVAAFPGFVGAAYLILYFLTRGKAKS